MSKAKKYIAVSEFLDARQNKVSIGDSISEEEYGEKTIRIYLKRGLIADQDEQAEADEAKKQAEADEAKKQAEADEAKRQAEADEAKKQAEQKPSKTKPAKPTKTK